MTANPIVVERKVVVPAKEAICEYTGRTTLEGGQRVQLSFMTNVTGITVTGLGWPTQYLSVVKGSEGFLTEELGDVVRAFHKAMEDART